LSPINEDKRYGRSKRSDELPAELARREERLKRIVAAKKTLEGRVRVEAEGAVYRMHHALLPSHR